MKGRSLREKGRRVGVIARPLLLTKPRPHWLEISTVLEVPKTAGPTEWRPNPSGDPPRSDGDPPTPDPRYWRPTRLNDQSESTILNHLFLYSAVRGLFPWHLFGVRGLFPWHLFGVRGLFP